MPDKPDQRDYLDADLERELAEALGDASIEDLMDAAAPPPEPKLAPQRAASSASQSGKSRRDDRRNPPGVSDEDRSRTGTVAGIVGDDVIIEFGEKEQGVCPLEHFGTRPEIGHTETFIIEMFMQDEGLYQLSRPGGAARATWDTLQQDMVVEAMVTGQNKGGLELNVVGQRAFMPVSQISLDRVEDMEPYVGKKLRCMVVELDRERKRIVVSARRVMAIEQQENRDRLMQELEVGQIRPAVIRRIEKFGAFAELAPGVDGLIHISDLAWQRTDDPHHVVKIGMAVQVKVLKVEPDTGRIGLGLKQVGGDPWEAIESKYPAGSNVEGLVTRTSNIGAFLELEPGVEGLIHISQLSNQRVRRAEDVVKPGDKIIARVLDVDPEGRRISLSIRALTEHVDSPDQASAAEVRRYVKSESEAKAMGSLMAKFGGEGDLKGGIG